MAYDVSKRPAEWTTHRAGIEGRRVLALAACAFGIGALALLLKAAGAGAIAFVPLVLALPLLWKAGNAQVLLAQRFSRGAESERLVGLELEALRSERFVVMHDIDRPGDGNVDHLVSGPTGVFLVETKHRSYIEKHLRTTMRRALALHAELGVFVTPVICLERRSREPFKCKGVWIVGKSQLAPFIRAQQNSVLPFDRLAAWADRL